MDPEISEPEKFWNGEYLLFERMKLSFARGVEFRLERSSLRSGH